ncbi:MAG TPA: ChaN family lipoprotein [Burkholderiaceae bacterium]|nr:ChaN family lipoprotein [Burkholderiaceae bacterium]
MMRPGRGSTHLAALRRAGAPLMLGAMASCASAPPAAPAPASVDALTQAMMRQPIVLLGEVHDNVAQHALRAQALGRMLERGARPAIAFEQFDRERQEDLDRARVLPGDTAARVTRVIEAAGGRGWNWELYRPYVALALERDLPIVAANLSRAQAMRLARDGIGAVFDAPQRAALGLDAIPQDVQIAQEHEIEQGHCGRVPREALPALALAQIARDAVLAQAIRPYFDRGVVLLTGNGHARRDIGVMRHLSAFDRARAVSIGLLEDDEHAVEQAAHFDIALRTPVQSRADPCANIGPMRMGAAAADSGGQLGGTPLPLPAEPDSLDRVQEQR